MLQLSLATSLEVLNAAIWWEASWIPETHGSLHTQLILEGSKRDLSSNNVQIPNMKPLESIPIVLCW